MASAWPALSGVKQSPQNDSNSKFSAGKTRCDIRMKTVHIIMLRPIMWLYFENMLLLIKAISEMAQKASRMSLG